MISHISSRCSQEIGITPASNPSIMKTVGPGAPAASRSITRQAERRRCLSCKRRSVLVKQCRQPAPFRQPRRDSTMRNVNCKIRYNIPLRDYIGESRNECHLPRSRWRSHEGQPCCTGARIDHRSTASVCRTWASRAPGATLIDKTPRSASRGVMTLDGTPRRHSPGHPCPGAQWQPPWTQRFSRKALGRLARAREA